MNGIRNTVILCVVFIAIVVTAFVMNVIRGDVVSLEDLRGQGVVTLPRPRDLGPFELESTAGGMFTNDDLLGKFTYLFVGFTNCPDICPTSMAELGKARKLLADMGKPDLLDAYQVVLLSGDPERDTLEKLGQYAKAFGSDFIGIRGGLVESSEFARQLNARFDKVPDDNGGYTIDHTANIVIINPKGHYHGFMKYPHSAETIRAAHVSLNHHF
ncbi:MAG: SCO family protein [Pseudomonadaceae bacterium]|nr:SCO family protein [Pseudomonadaceae bacterium]